MVLVQHQMHKKKKVSYSFGFLVAPEVSGSQREKLPRKNTREHFSTSLKQSRIVLSMTRVAPMRITHKGHKL